MAISAAQIAAAWAEITGAIGAIGADWKSLNSRITLIEAGLGIGLDPATAAFVAAAQISSPLLVAAIDQLVKGLKIDNIWSLIEVLYPFVGGTAASHSLNLKNPAQFPISWSGTLSHTAMGVVGTSGGDGIGTTSFVQTVSECYIGLYVNQSGGPATAHDWGGFAPGGSGPSSDLHYQWLDGNTYFDAGSQSFGRLSAVSGQSLGYKAGSRVGTQQAIYQNSTAFATGTRSAGNSTSPAYKLFRGEANPCPGRTYALAVAGRGLTPTQHVNFFERIQAFQSVLGRAV
jgi:hypothetical protein